MRIDAPTGTVIDTLGIHHGVREASEHRLDDLREDYPWVRSVLSSLGTLLVPCQPEDVTDRLKASGKLPEILHALNPGASHPDPFHEEEQLEQLLHQMAIIGLIERRETTGKIDVPDIFRIQAGIKRKGGITPQQRRLARGF